MTSAVSGRAMETRLMSKGLSSRIDWFARTWSCFAGWGAASDAAWACADTPPRSPRQSRQTALMSHDLLRTPHPLWKILFPDVQSSFSSVRLFPLMTSTEYAFFGGRAEAAAGDGAFLETCRDFSPWRGGLRTRARSGTTKGGALVGPAGHHQCVVGKIPHHELDDPVVAGKGEFFRLFREQGKVTYSR